MLVIPRRYALHDTRMQMCAEVLSLFSAPSEGEAAVTPGVESKECKPRRWSEVEAEADQVEPAEPDAAQEQVCDECVGCVPARRIVTGTPLLAPWAETLLRGSIWARWRMSRVNPRRAFVSHGKTTSRTHLPVIHSLTDLVRVRETSKKCTPEVVDTFPSAFLCEVMGGIWTYASVFPQYQTWCV